MMMKMKMIFGCLVDDTESVRHLVGDLDFALILLYQKRREMVLSLRLCVQMEMMTSYVNVDDDER